MSMAEGMVRERSSRGRGLGLLSGCLLVSELRLSGAQGGRRLALMVLVFLVLAMPALPQDLPVPETFGEPRVSSSIVVWTEAVGVPSVLTVDGPGDLGVRKVFAAGEAPFVELAELGLASELAREGEVNYSLRLLRQGADVEDAPLETLGSDEKLLRRRARVGEGPLRVRRSASRSQTGTWLLQGGYFVAPAEPSDDVEAAGQVQSGGALHSVVSPVTFNGDLTVQSNDPDISMIDLNSNGKGDFSFSSGESGLNDFAIQTDWNGLPDAPSSVHPFVIHNSWDGAQDHALVIDPDGDIGLGTYTPIRPLHVVDDYPIIRFEAEVLQSTQVWELWATGNVFQVLQGGNVVFRIAADAPAYSLKVDDTGWVGLGTNDPSAALEIEDADGDARLLIDQQGADESREIMIDLECNCEPVLKMTDTSGGQEWWLRQDGGDIALDDPSRAGQELSLDSAGNLTILGSLSQGSSRALKENLELSRGTEVLEALAALDLYEWSYRGSSTRHFGPTAEDFAAAFGLGERRDRLAPADVAGIALSAAKTLVEENRALREESAELRERLELELAALAARLAALEGGGL